jgi:nucleotide-binding universal stress UspA family protein
MTAEDEEELRRERAEELRRRAEELGSDEEAERPPGSPHEFIEKEMRERDTGDDEEGGDDDRVRPGSE